MNINNLIQIINTNDSKTYFLIQFVPFIFLFFTGTLFLPINLAKSEEIFLKCTGKYEIDRGGLIKPDWEISYLKINLEGLKSSIDDNGIKKEGRTLIRRNSYTITHKDNNNRIKTKYKIHGIYGTYLVDYPQRNKTLIGICQKGEG